jgi:TrfB plasmid transcriptional repressor
MATPKMRADHFAAALPRLTRRTVGNVELARRIRVDGVPQSPVAQKTGLTRKRINGMVNRVVAAGNEVSPGWECVEVWLLSELAGKVRQMADEARAGLKGA